MPGFPHRWARYVALGYLVLGTGTACASDEAVAAPTTTITAGQAHSPEQSAEGFLDAVGTGHADDALSFLVVQPTDRTLLTDKVLAGAAQPITRITTRLRGGSDDERAVDVSYLFAGKRVTDTYQTVRLGQLWFVDELLPTVPSFSDHPDFAAVTVAGKKADTDTDPKDSQLAAGLQLPDIPGLTPRAIPAGTRLLPGRYRFAVDHPLLRVENAEFTVTSLHAPVSVTGDGPHAHLTSAGQQAVAQAAQDALTSCLNVTTLQTGCGFSLSSDEQIVGSDTGPSRRFTLKDNSSVRSLDLGDATDLAATRPDWQVCRWSGMELAQEQKKTVCVDNIDPMVRVHVSTRTTTGTTETNVMPIDGYTADISDPGHIHIYF